ncbi:MAG: hypothetical protein ABI615_11755 [Chthoniobacterales bacterium]
MISIIRQGLTAWAVRYFLIMSVLLVCGCSKGPLDPYDPIIGPRNPGPGAEKYFRGRTDIAESEKTALLSRRACSPEFLMEMVRVPSREVRSFVASNPSINAAVIEILLTDAEPGVRQYLAGNPTTPRPVLLKLRLDPDPNVQYGLPRNPNWSADDIRKMYEDKSAVPSVIAANPSTPSDLLEELGKSSDYNIRIALANNPSIPDATAWFLAAQKDVSVRTMLTYNPGVGKDVLEILARDSDPGVSRRAAIYLYKKTKNQ